MKLRNHKRMKIIVVITTCLLLSSLVYGVVSGYYRELDANNHDIINKTLNQKESSVTSDSIKPNPEDIINPSDKSKADDRPATNNTTTPSSSNNQQNNQSIYTTPVAETQQEAVQEQAAVCNEAMKSSYTSSYNSQLAAENARWANQVNSIMSEAARRGNTFSGIPQGQIDEARPTHDAIVAQLQSQYYQNLMLINCNL